ncbi:DUF536 domain-containing protein [Mammaliicoccus sciuri]
MTKLITSVTNPSVLDRLHLKHQLEDKEKQISFLDNPINKLNETLDNQQSFALQSNDKIEKLETKLQGVQQIVGILRKRPKNNFKKIIKGFLGK